MRLVAVLLIMGSFPVVSVARECVTRHAERARPVVTDGRLSAHVAEEIGFDACHGDGHTSAEWGSKR